MMNENINILNRLKRHRNWRQIVDEYESCRSPFLISRRFLIPAEESEALCLIIERSILMENK